MLDKMKKKLEQKMVALLNKEDGFTLVELLAVLAILAIIVAIAVPAIGNVTEGANASADESQIELIEDAARLYFIEHPGREETEVTTAELVSEGFLEDELVGGESTLPQGFVKDTTEDEGVSYEFTPIQAHF